MLKKVTSAVLLMLMMVVIVTSHASIKYCLCNQVFVLQDTGFCPLMECQSVPTVKPADFPSCCGCCSGGEKAESNPLASFSRASVNCSDCMVELRFSLDDCVMPASIDFDASSLDRRDFVQNQSSPFLSTEIEPDHLLGSGLSVRGSPPLAESLIMKNQPLFIRYSAWLI